MSGIKTAKNGRKYIIMPNGRSRFIKSGFRFKVQAAKKNKRGKIMAKRYKRSFKRSFGGGGNTGLLTQIAGAAIYGGVREKISNYAQPLTNSLPFGNISDEILLGGLAIVGKKYLKNPMANKIFDAALVIESARIGEAIIKGQVGGTSNTSNLYDY